MKMRIVFISILMLLATVFIFLQTSCKKTCSGMGTLRLTNNSHSTVQRLMVDGVNHGTVDPGESKDISLAAGEHEFQQLGISGGTGCSAAKVIIVECETTGFSCSE